MVEVFLLMLKKWKVDGFIFEFGGASKDIKVFYSVVVWELWKDIVFSNFFSCLNVVPTIALFRDDLILK
jgi:hypothetical protein